jgi:hypothetical protein
MPTAVRSVYLATFDTLDPCLLIVKGHSRTHGWGTF